MFHLINIQYLIRHSQKLYSEKRNLFNWFFFNPVYLFKCYAYYIIYNDSVHKNYLIWHSHDFLLLCILIEDIFIDGNFFFFFITVFICFRYLFQGLFRYFAWTNWQSFKCKLVPIIRQICNSGFSEGNILGIQSS